MKTRNITINSIFAAAYIVISAVLRPLSFGAIQFRFSEIFNHLVVYNKKYFMGIVVGVFLTNLFFSEFLPLDLIFGVLHTVISLMLTMIVSRKVKNKWALMTINSVIFSANMFLIAFEIAYLSGEAFWPIFWGSWGTLFLSEIGVMLIGMPIMYLLDKRLKFETIVE